jgi:glyoxylase-like metal-dependent hydrolase (beta-lactamase superfamily II)/rhodanese-related sulfurtransferase
MKVEQIYTGCLAEPAYYIESEGEAVIINPLRETEPYLEKAKADNTKIKYVLETRFNADFVSKHLDLAKKTGAIIVYGPTAEPNFGAHIAKDNEELKVGNITIKVLHTPGHTMESTTYLLKDENGKDYAIFTGDTLFLGNVGRPDLAIKQAENTREDLAGLLYDSIRNKIMPLADEIILYPGHGAGSACGKKMRIESQCTLGNLKKTNFALRSDVTKTEFINSMTTEFVELPQYFTKNAKMNKMDYENAAKVKGRDAKPLNIRAFKAAWEMEEAIVVDTRKKEQFTKGFIPGSIFIGLDGNFAAWVGVLVPDLKQPILFVAEPGREEEVITRLARVGYDNTIGYLKKGFETWKKAGEDVDRVAEVSPIVFAELFKRKNLNVFDVRKEINYKAEHLAGVENLPLDFINRKMNKIERKEKCYLHCGSGYHSLVAASILKARGIHDVVNVKEGYNKLAKLRLERTAQKRQITTL